MWPSLPALGRFFIPPDWPYKEGTIVKSIYLYRNYLKTEHCDCDVLSAIYNYLIGQIDYLIILTS